MEIKNKKTILLLILLLEFVLISIFIQTFQVSSQQTYFCAERTIKGAWCQNVPEDQINTKYRSAPSSCESTVFCKTGTCVNGIEGTCLPNVPQVVCQEKNNGVWVEGKPNEISQCKLGCCYIGDGASFVTQTRCSRLASLYGLNTNFDGSVKDQTQCLLSAFPKAKGACVIDDGFSRKCKLLSRADCQDLEKKSDSKTTIEFHEGFLCSAASLGTTCIFTPGPKKTTCVENDDAVYFVDSCGNNANVYDASKVNDQEYWTKIVNRTDSCSLNYDSDGNPTNSNACGNCNYLAGSTCKEFERGNVQTPKQPTYGSFVCAALSCKWQGQNYKHGETWCAHTTTNTKYENLPGDESFRLVCYAGDVTTETPDPFRQTTCIEDDIEGFSVAAFRVNKWQDCILQNNSEDCENTDKRDCTWMTSTLFKVLYGKVPEAETNNGLCVPKYAPGYEFYSEDNNTLKDAQQLCSMFNTQCIIKYEKGAFGSWTCVQNCECEMYGTAASRVRDFDTLCSALGDCGVKTNYIGNSGWNTENYNNPGKN